MRNYWSRGVGNKTGPFDYLGYPIPLFGGEFGKQDSYVSKGGPLVGWVGDLAGRRVYSLNTEDEKE
ncbi:uncharacterized protein METZ01_LOCUS484621 [marine metagenome]|uniref:Uncharacterized protein n=1 Tax=marine metagenome TaxID=408172 RepID=A0A383CHC7_9ZZZZ